MSQTLLLHACCATCASSCVERLQAEGHRVILFFSNSNLDTEAEYGRRLEDVRRLSKEAQVDLVEDPYDHAAWLAQVAGGEDEPEGGRRCRDCFEYSMVRTAREAAKLGAGGFATSLTVSPHKSSQVIFEVGDGLEGFAPHDFKKRDGFLRSLALSKAAGYYRQAYCGCEFSRRPSSPGNRPT